MVRYLEAIESVAGVLERPEVAAEAKQWKRRIEGE
ncbi:hypothetical protein [Methanothrix sp.]